MVKALEREKRQMYEKGLQEGKEEGLQEGKGAIVRAMLARGMSVKEVAEITGLTEKEIRNLKREKA